VFAAAPSLFFLSFIFLLLQNIIVKDPIKNDDAYSVHRARFARPSLATGFVALVLYLLYFVLYIFTYAKYDDKV